MRKLSPHLLLAIPVKLSEGVEVALLGNGECSPHCRDETRIDTDLRVDHRSSDVPMTSCLGDEGNVPSASRQQLSTVTVNEIGAAGWREPSTFHRCLPITIAFASEGIAH